MMDPHCYSRHPDAIRARHRYRAARKQGICVDCGKPSGALARCPRCNQKNTDRTKRFLRKQKPKMRKLHICTRCRLREAMPNSQLCGFCVEALTDLKRARGQRHHEEGKCRCGREREDAEYATCRHCRTRKLERQQRYRAEGRCSCGREREDLRFSSCKRCRTAKTAWWNEHKSVRARKIA